MPGDLRHHPRNDTTIRETRSLLRRLSRCGQPAAANRYQQARLTVTAGAVAAAVHALGVPWGPAWVLGAAVAPTDATAVVVVARLLPRRNLTLLRAESLINDGTALVVYSLAVGMTLGEEHFSLPHVGGQFLISYDAGVLAGLLIAWLRAWVRRPGRPPAGERGHRADSVQRVPAR